LALCAAAPREHLRSASVAPLRCPGLPGSRIFMFPFPVCFRDLRIFKTQCCPTLNKNIVVAALKKDVQLNNLFTLSISSVEERCLMFFQEFLLSACQHLQIQQYVRLLSTWCDWNCQSRQFLLGSALLNMGEPGEKF